MLRTQITKLVEDLASGEIAPADVFKLAEQICNIAYQAQGGPSADPDVRDEQRQARERRKASAFEQLYCQVRDMADDFHRESIRRRDGLENGQFDLDDCDSDKAIQSTFQLVHERISDWDY